MSKKTKIHWGRLEVSYLPLLIGAIITVAVVYLVYSETQSILKQRLRERITSIAATAALQFEADEVNEIIRDEIFLTDFLTKIADDATQFLDEKNIQKTISKNGVISRHSILKVTAKMKSIRSVNINVKYVYILRPTEEKNITKFVTDSDTVYPVDWDGNGKIDEIEYPPMPGEDYDVTDIPAVVLAQEKATAMDDLYSDKWGTFLSGYAPIKDEAGNTVAVLGIDVQVDDFAKLIRATLVPFVLLAVLLLLMLAIQTISLVKIWGNRVEIVKELDRQKDELLSIVSHQLATPVSSVKFYIEMLLDGDFGKLQDEQKGHLQKVQGVTAELTDLVSMILDVSRIQLGKVKIEPQELDLNEFFKEILNIIDPKAKEKNVEFIHKIPANLPIALLDKRYTKMTVENLLSNAVKYTPAKGKVNFIIEKRGDTLHCEVSDTGIGIPKQDQDKIFGKLFRASNVRNTADGNGFGLYIAKGAIEAQGGKIWFESEENKGTIFYIDLPIQRVDLR